MKIFVIGMNKCGTSSIHKLLLDLNINSIHTTLPIFNIIDNYEAFTDGFHLNKIEKYYNLKPDSLFILNTRPLKKWLFSRYKHALHTSFKKSWCWPPEKEKTEIWINQRETHYKNIIEFFKDKPKQLLIVNIERDGWENEICKFLNKETLNKKFIYNTKPNDKFSQEKLEYISKIVTETLKETGYKGDEIFLKDKFINTNNYNIFL